MAVFRSMLNHAIDDGVIDRNPALALLPLLEARSFPRGRAGADQGLLAELCGLERRRGVVGRDRVDHRPGSHDDRANAVAGVVYVASTRAAYEIDILNDTGGGNGEPDVSMSAQPKRIGQGSLPNG
jgi:hypothetical protein